MNPIVEPWRERRGLVDFRLDSTETIIFCCTDSLETYDITFRNEMSMYYILQIVSNKGVDQAARMMTTADSIRCMYAHLLC